MKTPASKPEFSPLSLTRVLWKHRSAVLILLLFGGVLSFLIVRQLPSVYRSEAVILVDSQKIPERYVASTVSTDVQDRLATISQEILSTTRLQKIIRTFGLYREERKHLVPEEIIEVMRKDISIKLERGWTRDRPGAFRVGYEGQNPTVVAEVANQLANLFIEENLQTRERQAEGTADFIDSQLTEAKKALDDMEARVSKYKLAHNGDLPEQQAAISASLARLQIELQGNQDAINRVQQDKITLQATLQAAEASAGAEFDHPVKSDSGNSHGRADDKTASETDSQFLQDEYDVLNKLYKPNYPKMVALRRSIEKQKMAEDGERARLEGLKAQIALLDKNIQKKNAERDAIVKSIADYQARMDQLPVREQEMAELSRDYEMSKDNYKSLLDKKLDAGMASDMERRQQGERFTMIDPPRVPEKPIRPKRALLTALGCALSLGFALAVPIAGETKKNSFLGEWELAEGIEVLGRVPFVHRGSRGNLTTARSQKSRVLKRTLVSSVVLSILATCVAGAYLYWGRR
jgi:polysaccharide biosynthesis transport protein